MMNAQKIMALVKIQEFNQFQSNKWISLFIKYTVFYDLIRSLLSFCYHHLHYFHCYDDNIFLTVDYSKVPRSSGDGMEYSSSNSSDGSISEGSDESELSQRKITSLPTTTKSQMFGNKAVCSSTGRKTTSQPKNYQEKQRNTNTQDILNHQIQSGDGYSPTSVFRTENKHYAENDEHPKPTAIYRQNSTNILLQGAELPRLDHQLGLSLKGDDQVPSLALPVADLNYKELAVKTTVVEQTAEFVDSQKVINDLEEQNSKLIEEKTKLSVQLGVQTKV